MEPTFEIQTQQRDDLFGFVLTITNDTDSWTSKWIVLDGTTSHDEAKVQAAIVTRQFMSLLKGVEEVASDG
jgi:hypothetical protein